MLINLDLPKSAEHIIQENASLCGQAASEYVGKLVLDDVERIRRKKKLRALAAIDRWKKITPEKSAKNKQAWEILRKTLDEDRLSPDRPLFPEESSL